ncbi:MAG: hypothetical protein KAU58_03275 [Candidatus Omnitrophica bacterium]|nr:hypothetical protein [Candidatus Omnitrophota bacterium]
MKKTIVLLLYILITISFVFPCDSYAKRRKVKEVVIEELPPLRGPRKTIAVMDFENKAGAAAQWNLGSGMAEMLTTALVNSGRFIVVERQAITDVLTEQDFGASGRTLDVGAAKIGKILNAQVLVRGAVTEFGTRTKGGGGAFSFKGINVGMSSSSAHVAVNIRLYDATTGQIIDSIRCDGKATASGISGGYSGSELGGFTFGTSTFAKTPLGKATHQAIDKAVYFVVRKMDRVSWQGKIVDVKGDIVYINAGMNSNIRLGDEFTVYKKGGELIDPDTGISLGSEDTKIGRIQVITVEKKFSKANAVAGSVRIFGRGDIIRLD